MYVCILLHHTQTCSHSTAFVPRVAVQLKQSELDVPRDVHDKQNAEVAEKLSAKKPKKKAASARSKKSRKSEDSENKEQPKGKSKTRSKRRKGSDEDDDEEWRPPSRRNGRTTSDDSGEERLDREGSVDSNDSSGSNETRTRRTRASKVCYKEPSLGMSVLLPLAPFLKTTLSYFVPESCVAETNLGSTVFWRISDHNVCLQVLLCKVILWNECVCF